MGDGRRGRSGGRRGRAGGRRGAAAARGAAGRTRSPPCAPVVLNTSGSYYRRVAHHTGLRHRTNTMGGFGSPARGGTKYGPHHRHHGRAPPSGARGGTITYACALLRAAGRVGGLTSRPSRRCRAAAARVSRGRPCACALVPVRVRRLRHHRRVREEHAAAGDGRREDGRVELRRRAPITTAGAGRGATWGSPRGRPGLPRPNILRSPSAAAAACWSIRFFVGGGPVPSPSGAAFGTSAPCAPPARKLSSAAALFLREHGRGFCCRLPLADRRVLPLVHRRDARQHRRVLHGLLAARICRVVHQIRCAWRLERPESSGRRTVDDGVMGRGPRLA